MILPPPLIKGFPNMASRDYCEIEIDLIQFTASDFLIAWSGSTIYNITKTLRMEPWS